MFVIITFYVIYVLNKCVSAHLMNILIECLETASNYSVRRPLNGAGTVFVL